MEIKLFGRQLFSAKKSSVEWMLQSASSTAAKSKYLPDFKQAANETILWGAVAMSTALPKKKGKKSTLKIGDRCAKGICKNKAAEPSKFCERHTATPKKVYELKTLHDKAFKLNTNASYVDEQLTNFKEKLSMINAEEYDMRRGVIEISSIVMRLENRKKYAQHEKFYSEYPYTTDSKIAEVLKKHSNLQLGQVAQFLADMPKEATDVMKSYSVETEKLCDKLPVFYIIADKKDFQKTEKRRDPILLAQSPFGHVWQILGAWDKEMMLLEDL